MGFAASDVNLYRYVGNDPVDETDPSGLKPPGENNYSLLDNLLLWGAFEYPGSSDMLRNILRRRDELRKAIKENAIPLAVIKALRDLKMPQDQIDKLKIGLGNDKGKSPLSPEAVKAISDFLGDKLSASATTSGDSASGVKLNDNWELKIYKDGNEYSICVVTQVGLEHVGDAINYYLGYPINVCNAAEFLGGPLYTKETIALLEAIIKDCKDETVKNRLIQGLDKLKKQGIDINGNKPTPPPPAFSGYLPPKGNPSAPYPPSP
jgi:hypothetical protein